MVLLAASIFSKNGKALLARVFVSDMPRARLEGLLDAFPKLIGNDKDSAQRQHTFIETDSVRYVFHPLDNIYVTLVTTKASNILEDLETLRLFSRVIPEYCRSNEEKEILAHAFDLIHAFDEVVTLGYRESVNLAQIRTFTDMDSHEERVFLQIKEAQEKAAKQAMAEKAKELKRQQKDAALTRGGVNRPSGSAFASGISSSSTPLTAVADTPAISKPAAPKSLGGGKALKLGAKTKDEDEFLSQLRQQGQNIAPVDKKVADTGSIPVAPVSTVKREPVHIRAEEKISASISRDGAINSAELSGTLTLSVTSPELNAVSVQMKNSAPAGIQWQVHPNLEKKDWLSSSLLRLKANGKPFPINSDVGVLKWRMQFADESQLPIALNCWPEESADGCQVNITYTLQNEVLSLENVAIVVPLPPATSPVVSECDGDYDYQKARNQIVWTVPVIDSSNSTGTLEFNVPNGHADAFFPVQVRFLCDKLVASLDVDNASSNNSSVVFSTESRLFTEKYEIV